MNTLEAFNTKVVKNLQKQLAIKNVNAVPKIDKVIVAIGIGSLATRKSLKDFDEFESSCFEIKKSYFKFQIEREYARDASNDIEKTKSIWLPW